MGACYRRQTQSVTISNVVGQPLDRAVRMLTDAGLQPVTRTERVVDVRRSNPGTVIDQRVKCGSQVKRRTTVDLLVAIQQAVQDQAGNAPRRTARERHRPWEIGDSTDLHVRPGSGKSHPKQR